MEQEEEEETAEREEKLLCREVADGEKLRKRLSCMLQMCKLKCIYWKVVVTAAAGLTTPTTTESVKVGCVAGMN